MTSYVPSRSKLFETSSPKSIRNSSTNNNNTNKLSASSSSSSSSSSRADNTSSSLAKKHVGSSIGIPSSSSYHPKLNKNHNINTTMTSASNANNNNNNKYNNNDNNNNNNNNSNNNTRLSSSVIEVRNMDQYQLKIKTDSRSDTMECKITTGLVHQQHPPLGGPPWMKCFATLSERGTLSCLIDTHDHGQEEQIIDLSQVYSVRASSAPRTIRLRDSDVRVFYFRFQTVDMMRNWLFAIHRALVVKAMENRSGSSFSSSSTSATLNTNKTTSHFFPSFGDRCSPTAEVAAVLSTVSIQNSSSSTTTPPVHIKRNGRTLADLEFAQCENTILADTNSMDGALQFAMEDDFGGGASSTYLTGSSLSSESSISNGLINKRSSNLSANGGGGFANATTSSFLFDTANSSLPSDRNKKYPKFSHPASYGVSSKQGCRRTMEDVHVTIPDISSINSSRYSGKVTRIAHFSIYDGHGGDGCAKFAAERMHKYIHKESSTFPTEDTVIKAFLQVDSEYKKFALESSPIKRDGSCAMIVIIEYSENPDLSGAELATQALVISLGDSRVVLSGKGGMSLVISPPEHSPSRPDEQLRIESVGGWIVTERELIVSRVRCGDFSTDKNTDDLYIDTSRVNGELAVSRALGDVDYKYPAMLDNDWFKPNLGSDGGESGKFNFSGDLLSATPEIRLIAGEELLNAEFLVLACDGVFETITTSQAVKTVRDSLIQSSSPMLAANSLVDSAIRSATSDNATAIVIPLQCLF